MNPIKITLLTLSIWIIVTILFLFIMNDISEKPFNIALYSCYLSPFICIITFIVSSFFNRLWIKANKLGVAIFSIILIIWILCTVLYVQSLFR